MNWLKHCHPDHQLVDFVFVDGNHTFDGCMGDMEAWSWFLKTGSLMGVHDYNKANMFDYPERKVIVKGVDEAVNHLIETNIAGPLIIIDTLVLFVPKGPIG